MSDIATDITDDALSLSALTRGEIKRKIQQRVISSKGLNQYANVDDHAPLSDSTVRRYLKEIGASERIGKMKPQSRVEPYLNIRNAISKAAGLTALSRVCPLENMFSDDEVGIFLFGWHQTAPKLCTTKVADAFLRQNNVSLSTTVDPDKQRAAHIGATVQGHTGKLTCFYLRICDSNFPENFKSHDAAIHKPIIWCLDPDARFYVVTCHPSVTDTTVFEYIGKLISHPAIFAEQDATIARELAGRKSSRVYDSQSQPNLELDEEIDGCTFFSFHYATP
jgi:hypothetical protein